MNSSRENSVLISKAKIMADKTFRMIKPDKIHLLSHEGALKE